MIFLTFPLRQEIISISGNPQQGAALLLQRPSLGARLHLSHLRGRGDLQVRSHRLCWGAGGGCLRHDHLRQTQSQGRIENC